MNGAHKVGPSFLAWTVENGGDPPGGPALGHTGSAVVQAERDTDFAKAEKKKKLIRPINRWDHHIVRLAAQAIRCPKQNTVTSIQCGLNILNELVVQYNHAAIID